MGYLSLSAFCVTLTHDRGMAVIEWFSGCPHPIVLAAAVCGANRLSSSIDLEAWWGPQFPQIASELGVIYMKPGVAVPNQDLAFVAPGICRSLRMAHRAGFVHRDIRMPNVMCFGGTEKAHVQLIDFGLSLPLDAEPERLDWSSARVKGAGPTVRQWFQGELVMEVPWTIGDDYEMLLAMCGAFRPPRGDG